MKLSIILFFIAIAAVAIFLIAISNYKKRDYKGIFVNNEKLDDLLITLLIVICFSPMIVLVF